MWACSDLVGTMPRSLNVAPFLGYKTQYETLKVWCDCSNVQISNRDAAVDGCQTVMFSMGKELVKVILNLGLNSW